MTRLLVLLALLGAAPTALADIAPPRIEPMRPTPAPEAARTAVAALAAAITKSDEAAAKQQVDPRGWSANLVGGSGTTVADLYAQGARKRWIPKANWGSSRWIGDGALMVTAALEGIDDHKRVDVVFLLMVKVADQWLVLGSGESEREVYALGERVRDGAPLPPTREE